MHHNNKVGGVAQGEGPEFKPQYRKKNVQIKKIISIPISIAYYPVKPRKYVMLFTRSKVSINIFFKVS
jgi:hypothetical protein